VAHRKGFTLTETLIAIVVVSLLVLIGYPKAVNAIATTNVRGARTTVVNLIAKARAVATQTSRKAAQVEFIGNKVLITATPRRGVVGNANIKDTIGPVQDLNALYGVTVTPSNGTTAISFDPRGIGSGFGPSTDIVLTKSGKTQKITVDMLGRVLK
jgi:prepilin-type N-terminal cleavage/methylation domain-containing protein